jgi:hypothetical protein
VSISGGEEQGQKVTVGGPAESACPTPTPGVFCKSGKQRGYERVGGKETRCACATGLREDHAARGHCREAGRTMLMRIHLYHNRYSCQVITEKWFVCSQIDTGKSEQEFRIARLRPLYLRSPSSTTRLRKSGGCQRLRLPATLRREDQTSNRLTSGNAVRLTRLNTADSIEASPTELTKNGRFPRRRNFNETGLF